MLPKWYDKWIQDNPKDIYGPAILIGVLGSAVLAAALLVTWGRPFPVEAQQTGPRGTGMSVTKFVADASRPDPTLELYYSEPVIVPAGGENLAKDVYQNVQVLGDLTEDNFNRLMNAITQWVAPDQGCAYCHGDGDVSTYGSDDLYTKVVARSMIQMTQGLNENWSGHVNLSGMAGVNCYTCHRGQNVPSDIWFNVTPTVDVMTGWGGVQNRVTPVSQYTSLPSDALQKYLVEANQIAVHDLESRVEGRPSDEGYQAWQHTERTFSLMNYFSNSLNVNCVFCHNSRAFYDVGQNTPQWATAQLGIAMVQEVNNDWLLPLEGILPPNRLGAQGDVPKAACATCHKGYSKPMGGAHMIGDWPELAATGAPVYE